MFDILPDDKCLKMDEIHVHVFPNILPKVNSQVVGHSLREWLLVALSMRLISNVLDKLFENRLIIY